MSAFSRLSYEIIKCQDCDHYFADKDVRVPEGKSTFLLEGGARPVLITVLKPKSDFTSVEKVICVACARCSGKYVIDFSDGLNVSSIHAKPGQFVVKYSVLSKAIESGIILSAEKCQEKDQQIQALRQELDRFKSREGYRAVAGLTPPLEKVNK